jgi:hypothetical protein
MLVNKSDSSSTEDFSNNGTGIRKEILDNIKNKKKKEDICTKFEFSEFYDKQLKTATSSEYRFLIKYLFGENKIKQPLLGVLSIKQQLTEEQFITVYEKAKANKKKIGDIITKIENDPKYYKGKKSLYLTLLNWVEDRFNK